MSARYVGRVWPPGTVVTFHHREPLRQHVGEPRSASPKFQFDWELGRVPSTPQGAFATATVDDEGNVAFPEDPKPPNYRSGQGATFYANALGKTIAYSVDRDNPPPRPTTRQRNRRQSERLSVKPYPGERSPAPGERRPYYSDR